MANITVRSNGGQVRPRTIARNLLNWDPFGAMEPMWQRESSVPSFDPSFEIRETNGSYLVKADVPGVKEQDLDVSLSGDRLTVSGKREEEKRDEGDTYFAWERRFGSFARTFSLPDASDKDQIAAELKGGVLRIEVPKRPGLKPKHIDVKAEKPAS